MPLNYYARATLLSALLAPALGAIAAEPGALAAPVPVPVNVSAGVSANGGGNSGGNSAVAGLAGPGPASAMPASAPAPVAGLGAPASAALLDGARGGSDTAINTRLSGVVSGNSANHVVSGANIIQSGSFADAVGIPVVIQNSGANVLIQNATVINLQLN